MSSLSPGCSPTSISLALRGPSPKTVCVASFQSGQPRQSAAASRRARSERLSGTNSAAEARRSLTLAAPRSDSPSRRYRALAGA